MHADYIANPLYDNNPFIEALPPMLSGKDLIHALAVIPPYNDSDRDRSTGERLQLLSSLYEFYQPLSMTIDLYCEIYTAMQHCYGQYSPQSEAAAFQNGYSLMHGNALAASIGGGNSFSVVGVSGLGKSTALQRVLSLYPQVIEHTEYHGQKFYCHQIPYLVVQTPHDASIKALILDIYLQIDSLIGTTYQKDALSRRLSIDVLVSQLNQIVRVNHIGLLVIDELQNIAYRKSDGGMGEIASYITYISNIYKSKQIPVVRRNLLVYFYLSVYSMPPLSLFPQLPPAFCHSYEISAFRHTPFESQQTHPQVLFPCGGFP